VQCCADETADWSEFASTVAIKSCGRTSGPVDLAFAVDSLDESIFIGALDGSSGGCVRTRRDIRLSVESDISALMPRPHELPPRRQAQCVAACGSMLWTLTIGTTRVRRTTSDVVRRGLTNSCCAGV